MKTIVLQVQAVGVKCQKNAHWWIKQRELYYGGIQRTTVVYKYYHSREYW